jgi:Uma2 family endonuclease
MSTGLIDCQEGTAVRKWTREEYYQLAELGFFDDQRVELIDGVIEVMSPRFDLHAAGVTLAYDALRAVFGAGYWVRCQATLNLSAHSQPDPDISVVVGSPRGVGHGVQSTAVLVVEVSDTTLRRDRGLKAGLYAAAGIADYWIVNLVQRQLEIRRNPQPDSTQPFGYGYADLTTVLPGSTASPLAAPHAAVAVDDLLP